MGVEINNEIRSNSAVKMKLRRGMVLVILLALFSVSCVCSTDNLPDFITNLIDQNDTQPIDTTGAGVLLYDDFSDSNSGWEVVEYDTGGAGYSDGKYFVTSTSVGSAMWGAAGQNYTDVEVEVEATQVSAPSNNNNDYGVICRLSFTGNGYSFNISGDGFYSIQKMVDNEFLDLVEWTDSSAINQGNATNTIRAVCQGNRLALYVNGTLLIETTDDSYSEGDIALAATTYESESTKIHFDNIVVRNP